MYRDHYRLQHRPFIHAPGQRFLAAGADMNEAIARLGHVLTARDAIAVITGGPGVGKSTLAECAIASLGERITTVRVDLRYGEPEDLYVATLLALGEDADALRPMAALNALRRKMAHMVHEDQRLVLCLDIGGINTEIARCLLRLTNAAGEHDCQLNMVLMGPHPLHQQVDLPALIQLRQRISFRYRVRPLSLADTERYIRHQLEAVGGDPVTLVSGSLSAAVYCYVAGVPRLVNTLMDATLTEGCLQKLPRPDGNLVRRTAETLGWKPLAPPKTADSAQKAAPARSAAPNVAPIPAAQVERERARVADAPEQRRSEVPAASDTSHTGRFAAISLFNPLKSPPPAAVGGLAESKSAAAKAAGFVPMNEADTGATGMLRLQDLDERFAEAVFGSEADGASQKK